MRAHLNENSVVGSSFVFQFAEKVAPANLTDTKRKPMVFQDFVPCPVPINVATAMSPYFKDFGYVGVLIFGIIVGFVTGATYKLAQSGQNIMKMLYAYFLITLALQFFDELLFVGLSSLFQIIAVLIFCFVKISFREDSSSNSAV